MTTYERLTMAIERIQTKGWTQDEDEDVFGAGCAARSLLTDAELTVARRLRSLEDMPGLTAAAQAMGFARATAHRPNSLVEWNDAKGRTKDEVLARLEAARDKLLHEQADAAVREMTTEAEEAALAAA